jgi:sigma-B regulation protein RsbU (phosphoserine phosphatase)
MSIQPLKHSENQQYDYTKLGELISLSEKLASQSDFVTQFNSVINILHNRYSCEIKIWLSEPFLQLVRIDKVNLSLSILEQLSPIMKKASGEKQIIPNPQSITNETDFPLVLATPIVIEDEVWGIIQVEKTEQAGFSREDVEFIRGLSFLLTMGIDQLWQKIHNDRLHHSIAHLRSIVEINPSILSNLDRDGLLNSVVSLLYQNFGLPRVNIFTTRGDDTHTLVQTGISGDGIEIRLFHMEERGSNPISWCIEHKDFIVINDTHSDNPFPLTYFERDIQSEVVLPLLQGEKLMGVLELCSDQVNIFEPEIINNYTLIADTIAVGLRNANLFRSEHLSRLVANRLQEVIGTLSVDLSLDDVFHNFLDEMSNFIEYDGCAIWLIDTTANGSERYEVSTSFQLAAVQIKNSISEETNQKQPVDLNYVLDSYILNKDNAKDLFLAYPWAAEVVNSRVSKIRDPGSPYEPLGALLDFKKDYSAIASPLLVKDQAVGVLVFIHHMAEHYDNETKSLVSIIASYASIAIENARLYFVAHDQAWVSTVLLQVAEATQSITSIDELMEIVVNILPELMGVEACTVFLWDPSIDVFINKGSNGLDEEQSTRLKAWDISSGTTTVFEKLKESKGPIVLNSDTISEEEAVNIFPNYDFEKDLLILFPLITQNSLCGALLVDFTNSNLNINSSQEIWDEKYTLIQGAAHQAAIAIENLQLVKSQEEEAYISVALLQVAQAIVSLNQLDEILGTIVRITPILVGVKRCIIYLWDEKEVLFHQSQYYGFSKSELELMGQVIKGNEFPFINEIHQSNHVIYHALETNESPLAWNEISIGEFHILEEIKSDGNGDLSIRIDDHSLSTRERILIGLPISIKGENLGVMLIEEEDLIKGAPSQHIREKRIEIVKGITQQAAIAIKNELLQHDAVKSEIMERELQLAREIQAAFLPDKIPEVPGWDFDVRWQPARQVGGDFYDILILDRNKIGFVIADVADKGMPAALFMTLIRTLIRAAALEKPAPSSVLKQVNELLIPDAKNGMFVTVFYGVLSLESGKFVYANCGHNPPIFKQTQREELIELTRTGMALGIFSNIEIEDREVIINPGDWLMSYTDGVTEAFSRKDEMFGTERLFNIMLGTSFRNPKSLLDMIEESVLDFIDGADLSDDMTLVAIFRKNQ